MGRGQDGLTLGRETGEVRKIVRKDSGMSSGPKIVMWIGGILAVGGMIAVAMHASKRKPVVLKGAVIQQDSDPRKELPIADVVITASDEEAPSGLKSDSAKFFNLSLPKGIRDLASLGFSLADAKSDSSGFFSLRLPADERRGRPIVLRFRNPDYQPLDVNEFVGDKLYIARMVPIARAARPAHEGPEVVVANVMVRYSTKTTTAVNVGSAVKTFEVANTGNVHCNGQPPCSPDGKWKAATGSASLDAGEGNEFRNPRASCIAGPCPFTQIDSSNFPEGSRAISVTVREWSDTATFLLEAEVFHSMGSDVISNSYPVIFGDALNFTVPASAEGVSVQAELNGTAIVFPLGPKLFLSWADCNIRVNKDQTNVYRCELKPGYRFR